MATDVATYEFRCLMPRPRWKPGQFLHLALDAYDPSGHWPESRCFTMASGSLEKDHVRLTIAAKGRSRGGFSPNCSLAARSG